MHSRWHIASMMLLVLAALLLALFALQLNGPQRTTDQHGTEDGTPEAHEKNPRVSHVEPPVSAPELPPLKEPPPKPATKNDPATNKVWFRLLDSETNRPIANTPAIFVSPDQDSENKLYWNAFNSFGEDKTDAQGLFSGTFRDYSKNPRTEPLPGEPVHSDDADLTANEAGLLRRAYPLARNYEPGTPPAILEPLLLSFAQGKYSEVIDVRLRKMRKVTGKVVDSFGRTVPGAGVFAVPQRGYKNDAFLQEWSYYYYDIPPNDEAWERPGTRTAKIIQRHFEDERPTISASKGATIEPRGEGSRPDRFRFTGFSKWATFWTATSDDQGRFEISEMPRGEWVLGAWHASQGFATQLTTLIESDVELIIELPNDNTASVELNIEWVGQAPPAEVSVSVQSGDPYGRSHRYAVNADCKCVESSNRTWKFIVEGLREGIWVFAAEYGVEALALNAGAREKLTLRSGPGVIGRWRARVFGDTPYGAYVHVESVNKLRLIDCHDGSNLYGVDEDGFRFLPEGEYEASIDGAPSVRFTIVAGCEIVTDFNVTLPTMMFSVSEELAGILGGEDKNVDLTLDPAETALPYSGDQPYGFEGVAGYALAVMDEEKPDGEHPYSELAPARLNSWRIPRGVYHWQLKGKRDSVEGFVDLRSQSRVEFGLPNLPGMAVLAWQMGEGQSRENCRSSVESNCRSVLDDVSDFKNTALPCWTLDHLGQHFWSRDERTLYLVAPPGSHVVGFECDNLELTRVLEFPGAIQLSPAEFKERVPRVIALNYSSETDRYVYVVSTCQDGGYDFQILNDPATDELYLHDGQWTLFIERRSSSGPSRDSRREWGVIQIRVAGVNQTVNLASASYAEFGSLVIELSGKAPVENQRDPWWLDAPCIGIQALDIGTAGIAATGEFASGRFVMGRPNLKPILYGSSTATPPGRYKVIPWPGAPDSACKIVTVEPGKECVVRFEGR